MPSASTTGSPIRAAQETGSTPFPPPISPAISAATRWPVRYSRWCRRRSPSSPFSIFSMLTVGAPMLAARHDQRVIWQFVHVDELDRAEILGGLEGLQQGEIGVTATTRTQHRAAAS